MKRTAILALALLVLPAAAVAGRAQQQPPDSGARAASEQPAGQPAAPRDAAGTEAAPVRMATRAPRRSWTADRRELVVGDIITILVDESTLASAHTDNKASSSRSNDASVGLGGSSGGKDLGGGNLAFGTETNAKSARQGGATRQNSFISEMSVRVTAVDPAGRLEVRGSKTVTIDKSVQEITLTGWVRPEDVSSYNTVASARLADAELVYSGKGDLDKPRKGIVSRILGILWP